MAEYKSYINELRKCAKEHKNEIVPFSHIRTADLCNDTADLLEKLETESIVPKDTKNGEVIKDMIGYVARESEIEIINFLEINGYKRIITIYPSGNKIICWYEY